MTILTRDDDAHIATLTMNAPDRLNALSMAMLQALHDAFDTIADDDTIRVVILRGAGRAFCAGHDLNELRSLRAQPDKGAAGLKALFDRCTALMPFSARIRGAAPRPDQPHRPGRGARRRHPRPCAKHRAQTARRRAHWQSGLLHPVPHDHRAGLCLHRRCHGGKHGPGRNSRRHRRLLDKTPARLAHLRRPSPFFASQISRGQRPRQRQRISHPHLLLVRNTSGDGKAGGQRPQQRPRKAQSP
jgi:hypothetical protein